MLELTGINYGAVVIVWLIYMVVGAWWYSRAGFAKQWTKYTGIDILKIPTNEANKIIASVAVSALVQTITLAMILQAVGAETIGQSLLVTWLLWFGLTTATTVGVTLYGKRSWEFLWLNAAYFFVVMSGAAIIFAAW